MDIISYLLGKNSAGGGSGGDISEYFSNEIKEGNVNAPGFGAMILKIPSNTIVNGTSLSFAFANFQGSTIPLINTSNVINFSYMFNSATITEIPLIDTSNGTNLSNMFRGCLQLTTIPLLNISKATNLSNMFQNTKKLSNESLDNILQMCINATAFTGTKTLAYLGFTNSNYSASKIQGLTHYQDFIDAGWTIGY